MLEALTLLFALLLMLGALFYIKMRTNTLGQSMIVKATYPLGFKEKIVMVEIANRALIIGITQNGMTKLSEWPLEDGCQD